MLVSEDSLDETIRVLKKIAQDGKGEFDNQIVLPTGTITDFHWSVKWSEAEKSYFCTVHDVSEIRAVERLKARFLSIVSHDLRAPITSVGISLNILTEGKRGAIPEKAASVLSRAESSLSTLTVLVNELLDLDKLEAGKMALNSSAVNAIDICRNAASTLDGLAKSAEIKLEVADQDCVLWGDELRLTQALTNLISNAIKFSEENNNISVSIKTEGEKVFVSVKDNGVGISETDLTTLFTPQEGKSKYGTSNEKGVGFGLVLCHDFIKSNGGDISVKSIPDGGSEFIFSVPAFESAV